MKNNENYFIPEIPAQLSINLSELKENCLASKFVNDEQKDNFLSTLDIQIENGRLESYTISRGIIMLTYPPINIIPERPVEGINNVKL